MSSGKEKFDYLPYLMPIGAVPSHRSTSLPSTPFCSHALSYQTNFRQKSFGHESSGETQRFKKQFKEKEIVYINLVGIDKVRRNIQRLKM